MAGPRLEIEYCSQCRWLLRAAWVAQELLTTFERELGEVALVPGTGGVFVVRVEGETVWDRSRQGFPDLPRLKQAVRVLVAVVTLGVVCTALGFVLFFHLIAEVGPLRATVITYVNPAVALALGVVLRHEAFTAGAGLGFVLVVGGSVLTSRPPTGAGLRAGPVPVPQIAEP
ncbi:MAG TPA: SelT/SelW/SelH family protein [Acidimicrobiales bacterium]|nr:SelT/SelW/SelH family protein [Acidimicrobiales bacterium]